MRGQPIPVNRGLSPRTGQRMVDSMPEMEGSVSPPTTLEGDLLCARRTRGRLPKLSMSSATNKQSCKWDVVKSYSQRQQARPHRLMNYDLDRQMHGLSQITGCFCARQGEESTGRPLCKTLSPLPRECILQFSKVPPSRAQCRCEGGERGHPVLPICWMLARNGGSSQDNSSSMDTLALYDPRILIRGD